MYNNLKAMIIQPRGIVSGVFRLRNPTWGKTKQGQSYLRIGLEDCSTMIYAYSWQQEALAHLNIIDMCCVEVEGIIRWHTGKQVIDIKSMKVLEYKPQNCSVRLIPQSICPQDWLLTHLQAALQRITIAPLVRFINAVLGDDSIALAFVSAPASLNHHHNYPGGLLMHSLECFGMVEKHRHFQKSEYELGLVAALFHDIGKTLTMTHTMSRTSIGSSVEHDKLTFEVLGPYFRQLAIEWPEGATQLRYLLNWKMKRHIPKYNIADLVACSDRMSTGLDLQKKKWAS